jgi:hypothetical protein
MCEMVETPIERFHKFKENSDWLQQSGIYYNLPTMISSTIMGITVSMRFMLHCSILMGQTGTVVQYIYMNTRKTCPIRACRKNPTNCAQDE